MAAASASCRLTELLDAAVAVVTDVDVAGGGVHGHCNSSLELPVSRSVAAPLGKKAWRLFWHPVLPSLAGPKRHHRLKPPSSQQV